MIFGIQKRQWLFLFLALAVPLLLNAIGIWQDIGSTGIRHLLNGTYKWYGTEPEPNALPEILSGLLKMAAPLALLSWLLIFVSNRAFFQKQPLIAKLLEALLAVLPIAKVFEICAGFFMPFSWLPQFHDQIGLPVSDFTLRWSPWVVLPTTAIILFIAMLLSGTKRINTPSTR